MKYFLFFLGALLLFSSVPAFASEAHGATLTSQYLAKAGDTKSPQSTATPTNTYEGRQIAEFKSIVPIAQIDYSQSPSYPDYLNKIFGIVIQLGAILAVLMIVYGGFEYMTNAAGIAKKNGADRIRGAVTGLILLLASYLILFVINPCLVQINLFSTSGTGGCVTATQTVPESTGQGGTGASQEGPVPQGFPQGSCVVLGNAGCGPTPICQVDNRFLPRSGESCSLGTPAFMCTRDCPAQVPTNVTGPTDLSGIDVLSSGGDACPEGDTGPFQACMDGQMNGTPVPSSGVCVLPLRHIYFCRVPAGN